MAAPEISFVGLDALQLDSIDNALVQSEVTKRSNHINAANAHLRAHFTMHHADGHRAKYSVHVFFEHDGHRHTSDKHYAWDVHAAVKSAFDALETQMAREVPHHKGAPSIRTTPELQ